MCKAMLKSIDSSWSWGWFVLGADPYLGLLNTWAGPGVLYAALLVLIKLQTQAEGLAASKI